MKQLITLGLLLVFGLSCAQQGQKREVSDKVLSSIENDVWVPFMEAYIESDGEKLKSIHSPDIVRVTTDQNVVKSGETYLNEFGGFVENVGKSGRKIGISFAILTTAINEEETLAYQTGYYQFSSQGPDDASLQVRGYGKFSVGLKKVDGSWKIFLDSDERTDISKSEFSAQEIVYEL